MTNRIVIDLREVCRTDCMQEETLQKVLELAKRHPTAEFIVVARDAYAPLISDLRHRLGPRLPTRNVRAIDIGDLAKALPAQFRDIVELLELAFIDGLGPDAISSISPDGDSMQLRPVEIGVQNLDKQKLAIVTPLPPERSGIADYSANLIPELCRWYDVDVVTDQEEVAPALKNYKVKNYNTFLESVEEYDRIIYQVGNSHYHQHMFESLRRAPGVVALHDFYLGDVHYQRKGVGSAGNALLPELYDSHGYKALLELKNSGEVRSVIEKYPSNFSVFRSALGVLTHSDYAAKLAEVHYGNDVCLNLVRVPLPRALNSPRVEKKEARRLLGLSEDGPLVCSFGFIGEIKLSMELLEAWLQSEQSAVPNAKLVFVGQNSDGPYGKSLAQRIQHNAKERASITGWVDEEIYKLYLAAADLAVQLRANSRGETSAAAMDCLAHGLPLILNRHGYAVEIPTDVAEFLPEKFSPVQLSRLIDRLLRDVDQSAGMAMKARHYMEQFHSIRACGEVYRNAIETFYSRGKISRYLEKSLLAMVASRISDETSDDDIARISACLYEAIPRISAAPQVFVDVSILCQDDLHTGIQRVVRALVISLIKSNEHNTRIEPVRISDKGGAWHYRYARTWTSELLDLPSDWAMDEPIEVNPGDVFLGADYIGHLAIEAEREGLYRSLRRKGVAINFILYDLLPITMPEVFPPNSDESFENWLMAVARSSTRVLCISKSVADEFTAWLERQPNLAKQWPEVKWFHLGHDLESTKPTLGLPRNYDALQDALEARPTFLMVGTIEPRKGHLQVLAAFDELWRRGTDVNLVVVGREGWRDLPESARRNIPETIERLKKHDLRHRCLFWVSDGSDELLNELYLRSTCLIAASLGEGFGLPLIEAARFDLPIIARDIAVFREVGGDAVHYFNGNAPEELADTILSWLEGHRSFAVEPEFQLPEKRWADSALQLYNLMMKEPIRSPVLQQEL